MKLRTFIKYIAWLKKLDIKNDKDMFSWVKDWLIVCDSMKSAQEVQMKNISKKIKVVPIQTFNKRLSEESFKRILILDFYNFDVNLLNNMIISLYNTTSEISIT